MKRNSQMVRLVNMINLKLVRDDVTGLIEATQSGTGVVLGYIDTRWTPQALGPSSLVYVEPDRSGRAVSGIVVCENRSRLRLHGINNADGAAIVDSAIKHL